MCVCVCVCGGWVDFPVSGSHFLQQWEISIFNFLIFLYFPKNSSWILQQTLLASTLICCSLSPSRQHHQCWLSWGEQQLEIFNKILISKHDSIFLFFTKIAKQEEELKWKFWKISHIFPFIKDKISQTQSLQFMLVWTSEDFRYSLSQSLTDYDKACKERQEDWEHLKFC